MAEDAAVKDTPKRVETCPFNAASPCNDTCRLWLVQMDAKTMKPMPDKGFCSLSLLAQSVNGLTAMVSQLIQQQQIRNAPSIFDISRRH